MLLLTVSAATAAETPGSVYMAYRKALSTAKDFDAIRPFLAHGAALKLARDLKEMPENQQSVALQMIQRMMPKDVTILRTKIRDAQASMLVRGAVDNPATPDNTLTISYGRVTMALEKGHWKFVTERWESVKPRGAVPSK